jgi:hypothetical protein
MGTPHLYEIIINGFKKCQELITHFNKDYALMTENLRIMANRMVLLNPLVSLLKKHAPNTAPNEGTGNRVSHPITYVKSDDEEADANS